MKNIVLTGFMGTGKTEVGKELAQIRGLKLIDLDTEIEKSEKMTINEIFKQFGEQKFRDIESEMIEKLSRERNVIISTGGGAVLKQQNMDILKKTGIVICFMATPETILQRTGNSDNRPLLMVDNPLEKIRELLEFRRPFYEKADLMIDTEDKTPRQIAEEIIDQIRNSKL
ncbi:MAG: shikimate kinase [Nitrospira bacterium SM23_35]|jgi:shikimate kinase|nr:MAG: shikimate kinase [Nitrospira bacterium SM23_35]